MPSPRALAAFLAVALIATGFGLFAFGQTIPVYTNEAAVAVLKGPAGCTVDGPIDGWFAEMAALETYRHTFMQAGVSLILATLTCAVLAILFPGNGRQLVSTPKGKATFIVIGIAAVLINWAGFIYSLGLDAARGAFPWCADTIAIPIFTMTPMYLILAAVTTGVGLVMVRFFGDLPVSLLASNRDGGRKYWLLTAIFGSLSLLVVAVGIMDATGSNFAAAPSYVLLVYLFLSSRSALLAGRVH